MNAVLETGRSVAFIDNGTFTYEIANTTLTQRQPFLRHLYRLLQSSRSISSITYANTFGDSIGCGRNATNLLVENNFTAEYSYYVQFAYDPTNSYAYAVTPGTISIGPLQYVIANAPALQRPWYVNGVSSEDGSYVWSDVYLSSRNSLVETLSQPFFIGDTNITDGVLGIHLSLARLKDAFTNLTIYSATEVIIVTSNGTLVLDSCSPNQIGSPITCPGLVSTSTVPYPINASGGVYSEINNYVLTQFGAWDLIESGDTRTFGRYWVTFQNVTDRGLVWVAVIIINSDVYLEQVDRANRYTIIGISVFSVVAALIAGIAGVAVTRPISRTISQMDRISTMDFSKEKRHKHRSGLYEINAMEKSLSRLRTAMCSFEKFVPNRVIKEILSQDIEAHLGVTPWNATVFFCDIEDFTTIAELMDPTELVALLLNFLQEMSNIILEETHGTIDKFIGDAIMAFWNAPHPVENHAEMACIAAMRCHHKIIFDLRPKWETRGLPPGITLNARFGIHTGDMLIGNIGSLERINYTAIGDNVNIASRLESLCKFYQVRILISAATRESVKNSFLCRPLDMVMVKGKSQAFILYELVCELETATPDQTMMCQLQAASFVFIEPDPDQALRAYNELHVAYPEDVSIERIRERLMRLHGSDQWPGMEIFDHK